MIPGEIFILKELEKIRNDFLNGFFNIVTFLGEELILIVLLAVLYFAVNKVLAKKLFFVSVTSMNFNGVVKNLARVPRPFANGEITCLKESTATGYSFPSGHTQTFATWSTAAAFHFKKWWLFIISSILIVLVGFSRMYLGAHYLSDVLFGAVFGVIFAIGLSILFDKVKNKVLLYGISAAIFVPFIIYFMCTANTLYSDTFKTFGMISGIVFSEWFEQKYADFSLDVVWWKKVIRVIGGIAIALGVKELVKLTYASCDIVHVTLLMDAIRYFLIVVACFGLWPFVIKRFNF